MKIKFTFSIRLTIWYSLMLLVALAIFGTLTYLFIARQLYDEQYANLAENAEQISEIMRLSNTRLDIEYLNKESDEFNLNETGIFFEIRDDSGESIFKSRNFPLSLPTILPQLAKNDRLTIRDRSGAAYNLYITSANLASNNSSDRQVYYLYVGQSIIYVEKILRRIRILLLILCPIILALASLGGWHLARRSLGPVVAITQTARDISMHHLDKRLPEPDQHDELSQLVQTFNEMINRIQNGVRQIQQFTADASHELRTPLTIMRGEIEVALRKPRSDKEYQQVLKSGLQELQWMEKIVNELLLLSRADASEIKLNQKKIVLNTLLNEIVQSQQALARSRGLSLHFKNPRQAIVSFIDADKVRQMVINIIDNAIKYTAPGGTILVQLYQEENHVLLQFKDTGIGIASKDLPFVFDRFYRVNKARSRQQHSSGLGLAICRWIAEAHQGKIHIESQLGKGTTVTVWLPVA